MRLYARGSCKTRFLFPPTTSTNSTHCFSLVLLIFTVFALIYVNHFTNDIIFQNVVEIETLKLESPPTAPQLIRLAVLERQVEIAKSDRTLYSSALGGLFSVALWGIWYGFKKWHKEVQPLHDEMARIQLEIAKLQLAKLRAEEKSDGD